MAQSRVEAPKPGENGYLASFVGSLVRHGIEKVTGKSKPVTVLSYEWGFKPGKEIDKDKDIPRFQIVKQFSSALHELCAPYDLDAEFFHDTHKQDNGYVNIYGIKVLFLGVRKNRQDFALKLSEFQSYLIGGGTRELRTDLAQRGGALAKEFIAMTDGLNQGLTRVIADLSRK